MERYELYMRLDNEQRARMVDAIECANANYRYDRRQGLPADTAESRRQARLTRDAWSVYTPTVDECKAYQGRR